LEILPNFNEHVNPAKPKMSNTDEAPSPKINNASISELKATSDDAIAPVFLPSRVFTNGQYMKSLNYVQSHTLTDVRLALGYTAVLAVAAAAYYEYKVGFQQAKSWSMLSVGTYFLLNAGLYLWTTYIESQTVYMGKKGDIWV
jgi:signal peptidase complex subunit 2